MHKTYPKEFRDDVVAVARSRPKDTTLKQIASDFGISDSCLANWLAIADADEGRRAGPSSEEASAADSCSTRDIASLPSEATGEEVPRADAALARAAFQAMTWRRE